MPTEPEYIDFHGTKVVQLKLPDGSSALVSPLGAQLLSWNPGNRGERIYLSPKADFSGVQAVRGGVPVIFPQFAERGPGPRHGFARNTLWNLEKVCMDHSAGYASAIFSLEAHTKTRALWPFEFRAELSVGLSPDRLDMELEIINQGDTSMEFHAALHTYLKVDEVEESRLSGLYGCTCEDQVRGQTRRETGTEIIVEGEVDRIYRHVPGPLVLQDTRRALAIQAEGFPDVVVWNPWEEKCAALADMPANGFRHMLCVEAAAVQPILLAPGASWWGRQTLACI